MHQHRLEDHTVGDDGTVYDDHGDEVDTGHSPVSKEEHPAQLDRVVSLVASTLSVVGETDRNIERAGSSELQIGEDMFLRLTRALETRRTVAGPQVVAFYGFQVGHMERKFAHSSGEYVEEHIDAHARTPTDAAKAVALALVELRLDHELRQSHSPESEADLGILTH